MVNPLERKILSHLVCRNRVDNNLETALHKYAKKVEMCAREKLFPSTQRTEKRDEVALRAVDSSRIRSVGLPSLTCRMPPPFFILFSPSILLSYSLRNERSRTETDVLFPNVLCRRHDYPSDWLGVIVGTFQECVASHIGPLSYASEI